MYTTVARTETEEAGRAETTSAGCFDRDLVFIFAARCVRMYSFGGLSVAIFLYLAAIGLSAHNVSLLFGAILAGDLAMSLPLTTRADSFGRKRTLIIGAVLKMLSGVTFASTDNFGLLALAGAIGVISPSGGEIGPFGAVEQAALTALQKTHDAATFSSVFARYNLAGYVFQAFGAAGTGLMVTWLSGIEPTDASKLAAYRAVLWQYSALSGLMVVLYAALTSRVEAPGFLAAAAKRATVAPRDQGHGDAEELQELRAETAPGVVAADTGSKHGAVLAAALRVTGLQHPESLWRVAKMTSLFTVDAFAGGLVMQSIIVMWFHRRFGLDSAELGGILAGANILAGASALSVGWFVAKFGAVPTMVFTHLPSNVLLALVPLMPSLSTAVGVLLARFLISQMDVPARQAFVVASVQADERSAAAGITNVARSFGVALSPFVWGPMMDAAPDSWLFAGPFLVAGALKAVYDVTLYVVFRSES